MQASLADRRRGNPSERGYGSEWRRIRAKVMKRHGGLCHDCKLTGMFVKAVEVHHQDGDSHNNDYDNLIPLCREHHDKRHGVAHGRRVPIRR